MSRLIQNLNELVQNWTDSLSVGGASSLPVALSMPLRVSKGIGAGICGVFSVMSVMSVNVVHTVTGVNSKYQNL